MKKLSLYQLYFVLSSVVLIGFLMISATPMVLIKTFLSDLVEEKNRETVEQMVSEGQELVQHLAKQTITQKARDVSKQVEWYLKSGGAGEPNEFDQLATQPVGESGYVCIYDCKTAIMLAHPNKKLVGRDMTFLKEVLPAWWGIFSKSLNCQENSGFYDWIEKDGRIRKKYMTMTPVEGTTMMVAATIYLDEFNQTVERVEKMGSSSLNTFRAGVGSIMNSAIWRAFGLFVLFFILVSFGLYRVWRTIVFSFELVIRGLSDCTQGNFNRIENDEWRGPTHIVDNFNVLVGRLEEAQRSEAKIAVGEMAAQVSHDIKSPLAALEMALSDLNALPEQKRLLVHKASQRIRDIATNLLTLRKQTLETGACVNLLSTLVEEIVTEKRLQYRSYIHVDIESYLSCESYGLFANVHSTELKTVISNLVDNSMEARKGKRGNIAVCLDRIGERAQITVIDDGRGVPLEVLEHLGEEGFSYGKENLKDSGNGLGLHRAKTLMQRWGGSIGFESVEGEETRVTLSLPHCAPPVWFLPKMEITKSKGLVIIDDDVTIHEIWERRLRDQNINLVHLSNPKEVSEWIAEYGSCYQFLVDYEFIGESENGLDIVNQHNIAANSVIVTSRFSESRVQRQCESLGVKLLPKSLANYAPIEFM